MTTLTQQAFEAGKKAAINGESRAPATNKTCMGIVAKFSSPDFSGHDSIMNIMENFTKGYEFHINQECAKILEAA